MWAWPVPFHAGTTYTVVVKVVSVTVSKAVSMLVWTEVAVAVSVTVSVAASRDRYDEQKASPTSGTWLMARIGTLAAAWLDRARTEGAGDKAA